MATASPEIDSRFIELVLSMEHRLGPMLLLQVNIVLLYINNKEFILASRAILSIAMPKNRRPWHEGTSYSNPNPGRRGLDIFSPYARPEHDPVLPPTMLNRNALGQPLRAVPVPVERQSRLREWILVFILIWSLSCYRPFPERKLGEQHIPNQTSHSSINTSIIDLPANPSLERQGQGNSLSEAHAVFSTIEVLGSSDIRHLQYEAQMQRSRSIQTTKQMRWNRLCPYGDLQITLGQYTKDLDSLIFEMVAYSTEYNASTQTIHLRVQEIVDHLDWDWTLSQEISLGDEIIMYTNSTDALINSVELIEKRRNILQTIWVLLSEERGLFEQALEPRHEEKFTLPMIKSCPSILDQLESDAASTTEFHERMKVSLDRLKVLLTETKSKLSTIVERERANVLFS